MEEQATAVYLHIPFCQKICAYCDFCKVFYQEDLVDQYLQQLTKEVKRGYQQEMIKTLYIGGGTPSCLTVTQLEYLLQLCQKFHLSQEYEFTVEANFESLTKEKIQLLKQYGVNRISLGLETVQPSLERIVERHTPHTVVTQVMAWLQEVGITNINIDLMYALPTETLSDLMADCQYVLQLQPTHISTYSLILEPHTKLFLSKVTPIEEGLDATMYAYLQTTLKKAGYQQYEVANFSKASYQSRHNLVYWNNEPYYGFGLGASSYLKKCRRTNTRSLTHYLKGQLQQEVELVTLKAQIEYEIILGFRKSEGICKETFYNKFDKSIGELFDYRFLVTKGILLETSHFLAVAPAYFYVLNEVLVQFLETRVANKCF